MDALRRRRLRASWPGADLVAARSRGRIARRHRAVLLLLSGSGLALHVSPPHGLETFAAAVVLVGLAAAAVETAIVLAARDREDRFADQLISAGFAGRGRTDDVSLALAERIDRLQSARSRTRLARSLRWRVEIERDLGGFPRASVAGVCGFAANAELVEEVATALERGPCDPRLIVSAGEWLTTPLTGTAGARPHDARAARVRATLREIRTSGRARPPTTD